MFCQAEVLSQLRHCNIIQFYGAVTEQPNYCIVTGKLLQLILFLDQGTGHQWLQTLLLFLLLSDFQSTKTFPFLN